MSRSSRRTPHLASNQHYLAHVPAGPHRRRDRRDNDTVWIVTDQVGDDYLCFWYGGADNEDLIEFARVSNENDAVEWGRERSSRVQIRLSPTEIYWAGTGARPASLAKTWVGHPAVVWPTVAPDRVSLAVVRRGLDALVSMRSVGPLTVAQADRYEQLCVDERKLLCGAAPSAID